MQPEMDKLRHYFKTDQIQSQEAQDFIRKKLSERDRKKPKYIDSLLFSLDRLVRIAEKQHVLLALENRYHFHELPGPDDFDIFLAEFKGGPIGYWHDTGHAHANKILTLIPQEDLLETCSDSLIGIHFHDARGLDDHLPPGAGEIDFKRMIPYIKEETLLVMELKPGTPDAEVSDGIRFLGENGIERKIETESFTQEPVP